MIIVDRGLAERLERSEAAHWASLMAGLPADYGAESRWFGPIAALRCPGMARRSFVNRLFCMGSPTAGELTEAIRWMAEAGGTGRVDLCPLFIDEALLQGLSQHGFALDGFQMALFGEAGRIAAAPTLPPGVEIREANSPEDSAFARAALPLAFDSGQEPWLTWLTDSMDATFARPDWRTYVALVDGAYAGFAQLHLADGVGSLALAGTLPAFRGRGVQSGLIQRRILDAVAAGCNLVAGQTGVGTVSQWNMERLGLRIAYTKAELYRRSKG